MIGKRISKNMVIISRITTLEEFRAAVEANAALYNSYGWTKPARVFACMQFKTVASLILGGHIYSIIHYKKLQCEPPKKCVRTAKTSLEKTRKRSPKSYPIMAEHTGIVPGMLSLPPATP